MSNELEDLKLKAEIEKIHAETKNIQHPLSKTTNWIPIVVAIASVLAALAQCQLTDIKKERYALEIDKKTFESNKALSESESEYSILLKKKNNIQQELADSEEKKNKAKEEFVELKGEIKEVNKILEEAILAEQLSASELNKSSIEQLEGKSKVLNRQLIEKMSDLSTSQEELGDINNSSYRIFLTYYPSTKDIAKKVKGFLEKREFKIVYYDKLKEGQLYPRKSEIIYYSEFSKDKAYALQQSFNSLGIVDIPVTKSPYYGDVRSEFKLYVNLFKYEL